MGRQASATGAVLAALFLSFSGLGFSPVAFSQGTPPARSVKVVQGDTLEAIAARYGVSVQELMRLNRITKPEELQIGQQLKLPPSKGLVQVRAGDTLALLATRHRTTVADLQKANPGLKPDQLKVGAWLKLPPASAAKPSAAAKTTAKPPSTGKPSSTAKPAAAAKPAPPAKPTSPATPSPPATASPAQAPTTPPAVTPPAPSAPPAPVPPKQGEAVRWRFYGNTLVDWGGWKLHPGGVRVTLVQPTQADVGPTRAQATAVAVHCSSLRQAWLVNGAWEPWTVPLGRSLGQQIVLDLCANVSDPTAPSTAPPAAP
ncbi:LysM peptidoglycan-binding domain-containing protein [Cyanobium sp. Lug-B]|nr:LysM peptidoglycan-binding domain-containing protein [Cyanobium sp. Lug-B]